MPGPLLIPQLSQAFVDGANFAGAESMARRNVGAPAALVANSAYIAKVRFATPQAITTMQWYIGAAAGTIDAGIYSSPDAGVTLNRLESCATSGHTVPITVAGTNAVQSAALASTVIVSPGVDYWLALVPSTATTLTVGRLGTQGGLMFDEYNAAILALGGGVVVLPSQITGHSSSANLVWIRAK